MRSHSVVHASLESLDRSDPPRWPPKSLRLQVDTIASPNTVLSRSFKPLLQQRSSIPSLLLSWLRDPPDDLTLGQTPRGSLLDCSAVTLAQGSAVFSRRRIEAEGFVLTTTSLVSSLGFN